MRNRKIQAITWLLGSVTSFCAHATLIDLGPILYDTQSKLGWRDMDGTVGQSYDSIEQQTRIGGQFEGFRHATKSEVIDLFFQIGLPPGYNGPILPAVDTLIGYFGNTSTSTNDVEGVFSLSAPENPGNKSATIGFAYNRLNIGTGEVRIIGAVGRTITDVDVGHWLVTDNYQISSIPLPSTIALTSFGIFIIFASKNKANNQLKRDATRYRASVP